MAWKPNTQTPPIVRPGAPVSDERGVALGRPSILPTILPQLRVMEASFRDIPVPALTNFGTQAAWYKFGSWNPMDEQEFNVSGAHMQLLPCDVEHAGNGTVLAADAASWGDLFGEQACIVIGTSLPGQLNTWTPGPAAFAGMGSVGQTPTTPMPGPDYIVRQEFPPGKLSDNLVWKHNIPRAFGVNVYRIGRGRSLDIALCANPNVGSNPFNNAAGALTLCGKALVHVHCQLVESGSVLGTQL